MCEGVYGPKANMGPLTISGPQRRRDEVKAKFAENPIWYSSCLAIENGLHVLNNIGHANESPYKVAVVQDA